MFRDAKYAVAIYRQQAAEERLAEEDCYHMRMYASGHTPVYIRQIDWKSDRRFQRPNACSHESMSEQPYFRTRQTASYSPFWDVYTIQAENCY